MVTEMVTELEVENDDDDEYVPPSEGSEYTEDGPENSDSEDSARPAKRLRRAAAPAPKSDIISKGKGKEKDSGAQDTGSVISSAQGSKEDAQASDVVNGRLSGVLGNPYVDHLIATLLTPSIENYSKKRWRARPYHLIPKQLPLDNWIQRSASAKPRSPSHPRPRVHQRPRRQAKEW
jgi:hypothetical protein